MSTYEPMSLSRSFPKIAVICGADTDLGQTLLRELLLCSEIDKVHAIASSDPAVLRQLRRNYLRKVRVHILSYDRIDRALAKIPEADLAFCCLGTDRHAYESIGHSNFKVLNYQAPRRFMGKMFDLGVIYVSVLSHPKADPGSSSQMFQLRGDLEDYVRAIRKEAADFSPFVSVFKVSGVASGSSSKRTGVKDVAKAMRIDALQKSCNSSNPAGKTRRAKYDELDSTDVDILLTEARNADEYDQNYRFWQD